MTKRRNKTQKLSRRQFLERTAAATAAGALLSQCADNSGSSSNNPPINFTPIPPEQYYVLPTEAYSDRRVVRVYDRRVTSYTFAEDESAPLLVDADIIQQMLEKAVIDLARASSIDDAWATILGGDLSSDRIAIKVNLNGDEPNYVNNSPAMIIALSRSLAGVGVPQSSLTFFDHSRDFAPEYRTAIEAEVPDVILIGGYSVAEDAELRIEAPSMLLEDGTAVSVPAPSCLVEADHLINLHLLKGHFGGATGAMKNLFGLARNVWQTFHGNSALGLSRYERGSQCADLALQPLIREKSRLLLAEAVYGTWWHANKPPDRFENEALFPDGLPCSLVAGRNPLHHDMVLYDLVQAERDIAQPSDGYSSYPDDWLQNCAREPYEIGVFEHAEIVTGTFTELDLEYQFIDYRAMTLDV